VRSLFELAMRFLGGQSINRAVNILVGLLIIRYLPIDEYALYTIASVLISIIFLGSDLGFSQASVSLGARFADQPSKLRALYDTALRFKRLVFVGAAVATALGAIYFFYQKDYSTLEIVLVMFFILLGGWIQLPNELLRSILQLRHDSSGLFRAGLIEAMSRLACVVLIIFYPFALTAIAINFVSYIVARYALAYQCRVQLSTAASGSEDFSSGLKKIVKPMAPTVIYYVFQDQIGIFLLSFFGDLAAIAEVGAMGRLSMIIGMLSLLCGFLIQPIFARIDDKKKFLAGIAIVSAIVCSIALFTMGSVYQFPGVWLLILGETYAGLDAELEVAMIGVLLTLAGGCFNVMVVSRGMMQGVSWVVVLGIFFQVLYAYTNGVSNSYEALVMMALPRVAYLFVYAVLLVRTVIYWDLKRSPVAAIDGQKM